MLFLVTSPLAASEWTPLFNGKDTAGWKVEGDAQVEVVEGSLVGSQKSTKGGNIFTLTDYDNFELRFTYKIDWPANSGVWFRYNGKGYQFDILKYKNPVAFSGTLYCPGKMFITRNLDEKLEDRDGWNEGQIYANGDHLILWLNGKKVGECRDDTLKKGSIGIQVHGGDDFTEMAIHIKRIDIRILGPDDKPTVPVAKP
jgi:hypothetical protein